MITATNLANFLACHHLTTLDRAEAAGSVSKPFFTDPGMDLLRKLGLQHERSYLHELQEEKDGVVEIPNDIPWIEAVEKTILALQSGVAAVYQATFQSGLWVGRSDFLIRVERPSALGSWSYEVVETKLARSAKARALIQLCFYSDLVAQIQGIEPHCMHVLLGGKSTPEPFPVQHYIAYFRKVRSEFNEAFARAEDTYPEPVEHCGVCDWFTNCDARWRSDDHLSLVAGINRNQRKLLVDRRIPTLAALASLVLPVSPKLNGIGDTALLRIREQARLQFQGREVGRPIYELLPVQTDQGLGALPNPSPGDIFLDLEGDPYASDQGLEYLFGILTLPNGSQTKPRYDSIWSFEAAGEKAAFVKFIDIAMEHLGRYPDMHIYHYASYEPTHLKCLSGRHGVCADAVDQLLRAGTFVDLYRIVRQGLRASVESYSIKNLEPLYGFTRSVILRDAVLALQTFEGLSAFGSARDATPELIASIESYNRDDCFSALCLRDWLEDRRHELEAKTGKPLPRPIAKSGEVGELLAVQVGIVATLKTRLLASLPADENEWTHDHRALWLLAQMLEWHRREEKSAWWEYFRLCELSDDELIEDKSAIGGLIYVGKVGKVDQSIIYRYSFPAQEYSVDRAGQLRDPRTGKGAGTFVAIDNRNGTIDIKRGVHSLAPHPTALIPLDVFDSTPMRDSVFRLGQWVADHGIGGPGEFKAARDLLLQRPLLSLARNSGPVMNEHQGLSESGKGLMRSLSHEPTALAIQGPPGSGKTYTGARMVIELVKQGNKVGVTAGSHKVISNLLSAICQAATDAKVHLQVVQKANDCDGCAEFIVTQVQNSDEVCRALSGSKAQVAAGTSWLWSRSEMAKCVDVLFVDEAGQMSLANVLAISQAATSIVLLGDPQQLDQPQQGIHPPGAEVSALAHLLNGDATIAPDRGIFLSDTWRLHPDICAFTTEVFYDGRLKARPENERQRLNIQGAIDGTGLRFVPVQHSGNKNESPEEVEIVLEIVESLLSNGTTWTNKRGETASLEPADILVVAPYNAQISALSQRLPSNIRIGTVDKFQGQEAPVVIYSMTTSTPDDAPRGMEFLYSLNRLNVAVSRARCVTIIVASPALFTMPCKTVRQIELANGYCRYLELAQPVRDIAWASPIPIPSL